MIKDVEDVDGTFSQLKLWKLKRKVCPRPADPPMAKKDEDGNIITVPSQLKKLYSVTYKHRLRNRKIKTGLEDIYTMKMKLWPSRMIELTESKSPDWTPDELKAVLQSLKSNKSTDPNGMINELFKTNCLGSDLEKALLILFNKNVFASFLTF